MVAAAALQARKRPTSSWTAYDFFLQGRELADANMEKEAVPLFSRAAAIDPDFAHAHAWLAIALLGRYWFDADPRTLHEASLAAQRALELDSNDPTVHHANGMVMLWLRQHERAGIHFDRAVALNPADAQIRADRANWLRYAGRPEEALAAIDDALRRSPFPPHWFWRVRGGILLDLKRYGEAVEALDNMPQKNHFAWLLLAAAHAHLGHPPSRHRRWRGLANSTPGISLRELIAVLPSCSPGGARSSPRWPAQGRPGGVAGPASHRKAGRCRSAWLARSPVRLGQQRSRGVRVMPTDCAGDNARRPSGGTGARLIHAGPEHIWRMQKRSAAMKCPLDGSDLAMSERHGIEIDYCPTCRGVWLDRGELDKIIERATPEEEPGGRQADGSRERDRPREPDRPRYDDDDRKYSQRPYKKRKSLLDDIFDF